MPRKTLAEGTSRKHETKARKAARSRAEAEWRRGSIADYEPATLSPSGMEVFAALAMAMPEAALAKVDGYTLETAADAIDKMRECRERIEAEGLTVIATNGNGIEVERPNDHIAIYQKYSDIAKKYLVELGLTPSARGKIASDAAAAAVKPMGLREMLAEGVGGGG